MAIRTRTAKQREFEEQYPEAARLQRKADQHDELGCLASIDGDKINADKSFAEAQRLRKEAREAMG